MNEIKRLLELEKNEYSENEIEIFLLSEVINLNDYFSLLSYLLKIKFELEKYEEVIKLGNDFYQENKDSLLFKNAYNYFELLYKSSVAIKDYEFAYLITELIKESLPELEKYKAALYVIELKKLTNQNYSNDIEMLVRDFLPNEIKVELLNDLLTYYLNNNEENKVIPIVETLKPIDFKLTYMSGYLESLYRLKMDDELLRVALKHKNNRDLNADIYLAFLRYYLKKKDSHRIPILDADYYDQLSSMPNKQLKEIYLLLISYYKSINNKLNEDIYNKKYKELLKEESKIAAKEQSVVKPVETEKSTQSLITEFKSKSINLEDMHILIDLINYSHQISETKNLRDYLRLFFIKISEFVKVKDFIVFKKKNQTVYHYKKERLYDKELIKETYENTIISQMLKDGEERFGIPSSFTYQKNILTNKDYDDSVQYIYSYPLFDLGVFIIHLEEKVTDPAIYYDLFKGLSSIIYTILMDEEKQGRLKSENHFLNQIISSELIQMRVMDEYQSTFNVAAQKLFNVTSHVPFEIFIKDINLHEHRAYNSAIKELYQKVGLRKTINFNYQNKAIQEKMVSIKDGEHIKIVSFFEDLSDIYKEKNNLIRDAKVDFETSLENLNALNDNFPEYINSKCSFVLISFNESILPIYGYDVTLQYFKEFGQITKKIFDDGTIYRFSNYELFLYLPYNDIRSVTKRIKDYLRYIEKYESSVISYEQYMPKLSIIRYPVVTEEKNPAKIFRYLEISLDHLKRISDDESFIFFEHRIYEDEVFEQEVINHLNEAIEKSLLSVTFNQIIDVERNMVWQYESELMVENLNIDSKYFLSIAKKRNRLFDLEKYHIKMVFEFLHYLEKETEKLIKITIPVSKESFMNLNFNPYLFGLFKEYKIPFEFIRLKIKGDHFKTSQFINIINELATTGIGLDTTSVEISLSYPFNAVHLDFKDEPKWFDYIKVLNDLLTKHQMSLIIRNLNNVEQRNELTLLGIKYVEGSIYKRITADRLFYKIKNTDK